MRLEKDFGDRVQKICSSCEYFLNNDHLGAIHAKKKQRLIVKYRFVCAACCSHCLDISRLDELGSAEKPTTKDE